jgi:hypothetical protein
LGSLRSDVKKAVSDQRESFQHEVGKTPSVLTAES